MAICIMTGYMHNDHADDPGSRVKLIGNEDMMLNPHFATQIKSTKVMMPRW